MREKKLTTTVVVKNNLGLHTRPATSIVKLLQNFSSHVLFKHNENEINAKSILSILLLAAKKNSKIRIEVEGDDAEEALEKLVNAFDNEFEE